jgi:Zn-dependent protease with chaperone function
MPFLLLLVLTFSCLQRDWPDPPAGIGQLGAGLLAAAVPLLFGLTAWVAGRGFRTQLERDPLCRGRLVRRYSGFRRWHAYALLLAQCLLVSLGGWGATITGILIRDSVVTPGDSVVVPGIDLVILAPLFFGLVLSWAGYQPLEHALAATAAWQPVDLFPGRWGYVALQVRQNFLLVAPPLLLIIVQQILFFAWPPLQHDPLLLPAIGFVLLVGMYTGIPLVLRILLGLQPLPAGPLRDRLLATARRLNFRLNDILIWDTRQTIVNAMVTGPLPWLRYVVLTDRLVLELAPEEVEAVFGHEVGHIKHHHLLFYFGFLMASMVAVVCLWSVATKLLNESAVQTWLTANLPWLLEWLQSYELLSILPLLGILGAYVFVVFGFLSRRCERQADIYGCRTVSVPVFVDALEKVARLNGISRDRPGWLMSWQHSTIARRVEFLEQMHADPMLEPRFQRRVGLVKWGLVLSLAALLVAMGPDKVWAVLMQLGN